jgi:hypothetical protein
VYAIYTKMGYEMMACVKPYKLFALDCELGPLIEVRYTGFGAQRSPRTGMDENDPRTDSTWDAMLREHQQPSAEMKRLISRGRVMEALAAESFSVRSNADSFKSQCNSQRSTTASNRSTARTTVSTAESVLSAAGFATNVNTRNSIITAATV